jgi:hypothetical protein
MKRAWKIALALALVLGSGLAQNLRFQRWADPQEGAFSLEVPAGWQVQGGTTRPYGGTGVVTQVTIASPDGSVRVQFGDYNLPTTFIEPNPTLASLGYGEGSRPSTSSMVLRYMSGSNFSGFYVAQSLGQRCNRLAWTRKGDYPDHVRQQNQLLSQTGLQPFSGYSAGDINFRCQAGGKTLVGYQYAETYATTYQGTATAWALRQTYGYVATPEKAALADAVLSRAISTNQVNPQWFRGEYGHQEGLLRMQARYYTYTADLMQRMHNERLKAMDKWAKERGDLLSNNR